MILSMNARSIWKIATLFMAAGGMLLCCGLLYAQASKPALTPLPDEGGRQGQCVLWFIGSSSIRGWDTLGRDMAPWAVHNRGINGALLASIALRFGLETERRAPEAIILYAGENDIATGRTADQVLGDLKTFLDHKTRQFGDMPLFVVAMKPTPLRWPAFAEQARFNAGAAELARTRRDMTFIDIVPLLLTGGKPGDFYIADGLHLNVKGYALWTRAIRDALEAGLPAKSRQLCEPGLSGRGVQAAAAAKR